MEVPAIPANQSEPEEVPETVDTLPFKIIRANQRTSQRPRSPLPFQLIRANQRSSRARSDPAIAANQSEREKVPETVETLPFQLLKANQRRSHITWRSLPLQLLRKNQRRSQRPWRPCH